MVLRDPLALVIDVPKNALSVRVAPLGKGAPQSERRCIVALLVGGYGLVVGIKFSSSGSNGGILKRPSGHRASEADGKDESGDGCLDDAVHPTGPLYRHRNQAYGVDSIFFITSSICWVWIIESLGIFSGTI
jgi:hypothetical protein